MAEFVKIFKTSDPINKGDKFAFEGDLNDIQTYGSTVSSIKYSDKKIESFLCSDEIKLGDNVYYSNKNVVNESIILVDELNFKHLIIVGAFKIIKKL